ncbi:collagen-like protein [Streptomyces sp. YKOK-I1]
MSAGHANWRQQQRRKDVVFGLFLFAGIACLALLALWVQGLSRDLHTAVEDRDALAAQVRELGGKPVAGPKGEPGTSVTGPPGAQGVPGPTGPSGPSGAPGRDGTDGVSGTPGATGQPGAVGATGPQGERGATGPQGEQGPRGNEGPAGPACPDGYSLQAPAYDPDALVCRRDGGGSGEDGGEKSPQALALDPQRKQYA